MDPRRALARLAAQSLPMEPTVGAGPELTQADVAAACAGLTPEAWDLLAAKWVQGGMPRRMYASLLLEVEALAHNQGWQVPPRRPYLARMVALAILEVVDPQTCNQCRGTGFLGIRECRPCHATGRRRMWAAQRARAVGVHKSQWHRSWAGRYERIYRRVASIEVEGLSHVARGLRSEIG